MDVGVVFTNRERPLESGGCAMWTDVMYSWTDFLAYIDILG